MLSQLINNLIQNMLKQPNKITIKKKIYKIKEYFLQTEIHLENLKMLLWLEERNKK
jgi:predicted RNA-binding protein YlqC (UPF0109 family)